jgi:hypothetical protein
MFVISGQRIVMFGRCGVITLSFRLRAAQLEPRFHPHQEMVRREIAPLTAKREGSAAYKELGSPHCGGSTH